MTREEIREGIYTLFSGCFTNVTKKIPTEEERGWFNAYTEQMQVYLHSQGVVIKIPVAPPIGGSAKMCCYEELIDTDDVAFEPKSTRTIKGKIVSRERGKFITDAEPLI